MSTRIKLSPAALVKQIGCVLLVSMALAAMPRSADAAFEVYNLRYTLYNGVFYLSGSVEDNGADTEGYTVYITGDVEGSAEVKSEGEFYFAKLYAGSYGHATIQAVNPDGEFSEPVQIEFGS